MPRVRNMRRGRPSVPFRMDDDRHAVALTEMMLHTAIDGRTPTERFASWRAAIAKEGRLLTDRTIPEPPKRHLAPTGRRHSPENPLFNEGYRELTMGHVDRRQGGDALVNCAQRLRRKRRAWSKRKAQKEWLKLMAQAWAAAIYPHAVQRDRQEDPADICMKAAVSAGEQQFGESTLLPLLRSNETVSRKRQRCEQVICSIF